MAPPTAATPAPSDAMSKKSKADSKKQMRKQAVAEAVARDAEAKRAVAAASADPAPLAPLAAFARFGPHGGLTADVRAFTGAALPSELAEWALGLCRANMRALYEPVWGWSDRKKQRELAHEDARFFVAFGGGSDGGGGGSAAEQQQQQAGDAPAAEAAEAAEEGQASSSPPPPPIAYVHYRFELEDGAPVAYCYELQLGPAARRRGLGRHMMVLLELVALRAKMSAVLLTVMRANDEARAFYAALGYREHESSPGYEGREDPEGYVILHKPLQQKRAGAAAANS